MTFNLISYHPLFQEQVLNSHLVLRKAVSLPVPVSIVFSEGQGHTSRLNYQLRSSVEVSMATLDRNLPQLCGVVVVTGNPRVSECT